jgi:hypothetical protein
MRSEILLDFVKTAESPMKDEKKKTRSMKRKTGTGRGRAWRDTVRALQSHRIVNGERKETPVVCRLE